MEVDDVRPQAQRAQANRPGQRPTEGAETREPVVFEADFPPALQPLDGGRGGVGSVSFDPKHPDRLYKSFDSPLTGRAAKELAEVFHAYHRARPSDRYFIDTRIAWPTALVGDPEHVLGLALSRAPQSAHFDMHTKRESKRQLLQLAYVLDEKYWVTNAFAWGKPELHDQDRIQLAVDFIDTLAALHASGLVYGDVSAKNVCVVQGPPVKVFLLDPDSISSPRFRDDHPLQTPDWEPARLDLDATSADRSVAALLVWRLLVRDASSRPNVGDTGVTQGIAEAIRHCYDAGEAAAFRLLRDSLASARDEATRQAAAHDPRARRFARVLLRDLQTNEDAPKVGVLRLQSRIDLEDEASAAFGARRARLISQLEVDADVFDADVLPEDPTRQSPQMRLEELVHEARFADIAEAVAAGDLDELRDHPWTIRAVEHALWQVGPPPQPRTRATTTGLQVDLRWPTQPYVTGAHIRCDSGQGPPLIHAIRRGTSPDSSTTLTLARGFTGQAFVTYTVAPMTEDPSANAIVAPVSSSGVGFQLPVPQPEMAPEPSLQGPQPEPAPLPERIAVHEAPARSTIALASPAPLANESAHAAARVGPLTRPRQVGARPNDEAASAPWQAYVASAPTTPTGTRTPNALSQAGAATASTRRVRPGLLWALASTIVIAVLVLLIQLFM